MDQKSVFFVMLGMLAVTYLPRLIPVLLFSSRQLPPLVVTWLRYVPAAVLSAMLFPSLFVIHNQVDLSFDNLFLWAAVPTFAVAFKTKSLFGAVVVGMLVVALARAFFRM
ncbi:MAG: AzlD domain-containing protein [Anaerolineae bacterium]|nr:AzlD domain-containing protein [Anaerolineae bacterium]